MVALACGLLALGVAAFLISPLLDRQISWFGGRPELEDLNRQKDFLYSALRELNIDHKMGKLSDQDHEQLQSEYMQEASDVLDQLERASNGKHNVGDRVEQAVLEIRRKRSAPGPKDEEKPPVGPEMTSIEEAASGDLDTVSSATEDSLACGACGRQNESGANFCIECGQARKVVPCESCGSGNTPDANFCANCGEKNKA